METRRGSWAPALLLALALPAAGQHESKVRQPPPSPERIAELPPDGGPEFNRLVHEKSPYLLQHARNPVDWYPWGAEAFERAAKENKPVFLSVGYSTCHWCHVMEHESFEDEEVAALMNATFVCVKVDREERPDIDQVYMNVTQAMTGRGGWPMTVVMTPDKKPFFAGTYFPKTGRMQRPGMMDLVPQLAELWANERERVDAHADQVTNALASQSSGTPGDDLTLETLDLCFRQLSQRYDAEEGGFGKAPKFPVPHNLRFLLRYHARTGDARALEMVEGTLRKMRAGGIWDQLGYGFHRYSTDRRWLVPHFEKMLYDQALIAMACVEAWQVTGRPEYEDTARKIFEYVLRDMTSPDGGFYSAEDADSEGEEGLFYLWSKAELRELLEPADRKIATAVWGLQPEGNFNEEGGRGKTGRNILHLDARATAHAAELGLEPEELTLRLESIRARLFETREGRIHPLKDDKILTDWNGLMIAALATAAKAFEDERYADAARRSADFVLEHLRDEDGRLLKRYRGGAGNLQGMAEDYAFFVWGLIELYEATFEPMYLRHATVLQDAMCGHFWDEKGGGFFTAPSDGEELIVRTKEVYDGALPSANSVAALNLLRLARFRARPRWEDFAERTLRAFSGRVARAPGETTQLMLALDFALGPAHEVVIAGAPGAADTKAMLRALQRPFLPNKVVVFRPEGEERPDIVSVVPYAAPQTARDGAATAYVCRDFACEAPTTDIETMLAHLAARDDR